MNRSKLNYSLFLLLFWRTVCWAFMSFHRSALLILPIMEKKDEENEKTVPPFSSWMKTVLDIMDYLVCAIAGPVLSV